MGETGYIYYIQIARAAKTEALPTAIALLKTRVARLLPGLDPTEEIGEGRSKVSQGVIGDGPRQLLEPSHVSSLSSIDLGIEFLPVGLFSSLVHLLPAGETVVENSPGCTGASLEERRLDVIRLKSYSLTEDKLLISLPHGFSNALSNWPLLGARIDLIRLGGSLGQLRFLDVF